MNQKIAKNKVYLLIWIILVAGTFLRFYDLSTESLWTDEMITLNHLKEGTFKSLIDSVIYLELTPPGYFVMLSSWIHFFGDSEFFLRFLSVLFDIASIILVYFIGTKLFNPKVGLISALLLSTTMLQIVYAQEARPYSMFGFLVLLSTYLFILIYHKIKEIGIKENQPKNKLNLLLYLVAYTLVNALALYVGYMMIFVLIFHGLILLFAYVNQKAIKTFLFSIFGTILLFLPGMQILYIQSLIRHANLRENLAMYGVPLFLSKLGLFFYLLPLTFLLIVFVILILYLKLYLKKRSWPEISPNTILVLTFILAIIIGVMHLLFLEVTMRSFTLIRHSFFVVPFFYILLALTVTKLKSNKIQAVVLILILCFNTFTLYQYYHQQTKAPWREAVDYIENTSPENTLILFDRSGSNVDLFNYYHSSSDYEFRYLDLTWKDKSEFKQIDETQLLELLNKEKYFWLISSRNLKTRDHYQNWMNKHYSLTLSQHYKELDIYYYQKQ